MLRQNGRPGQCQGFVTGKSRDRVGILAKLQHGDSADKYAAAYCYDDQAERGGIPERSDRETLEHYPDCSRKHYRQKHCSQYREVEHGEKKIGEHSAQHDELALGEIDDAGGVVYDCEPYPDERVNRSGGKTRQHKLQYLM